VSETDGFFWLVEKWRKRQNLKIVIFATLSLMWPWKSYHRECLIDRNKYHYLVCGCIVFHCVLMYVRTYIRMDGRTFLLGLLGQLWGDDLKIRVTLLVGHQEKDWSATHKPFYSSLDFVRDNLGELVPEKKHSPTHTYRGHPLSASSIYYDPRHPPCSIYVPDSLFTAQPHQHPTT